MDKKEKKFRPGKSTVPGTLLEFEPESLKENPEGETICHADFSDGCLNEDTISSPIKTDEDKK